MIFDQSNIVVHFEKDVAPDHTFVKAARSAQKEHNYFLHQSSQHASMYVKFVCVKYQEKFHLVLFQNHITHVDMLDPLRNKIGCQDNYQFVGAGKSNLGGTIFDSESFKGRAGIGRDQPLENSLEENQALLTKIRSTIDSSLASYTSPVLS